MSDYARYSAMGLQMAAFIVVCTFAGRFLDKQEWIKFPAFTIAGLIIGVFGAMYYMIRQLK